MKAQELKKGNLISDGIFTIIVKTLEENTMTGVVNMELDADTINDYSRIGIRNSFGYKNLVPIPLTEEWLLKFGFKKVNEFYELNLEHGLTLMQGDKNGYLDVYELNYNTLRVKFVHQLQNLYYCLTGKELKLTS